MFKSFLFLLFVTMFGGQVWANCDAIVEEISKEETPTTSFIALLQKMIENQHMSEDHYQMLINSIEAGKAKLPWSAEDLSAHSSVRLFGNLVSDYLNYWLAHPDYLDRETVVKMGRENLKKWRSKAVERSETKEETKIPILKMELIKIPAGKLVLENGARELVLPHDVEVQKYVVTQAMWVELMGENPSQFAKGDNEATVVLHGKKITMQPNHPVENINWFSALFYANRLSEKEGFKPVYDFGRVTKFSGTAEAGDYEVLEGEIRINETDGYRLPTRDESEYIGRGGAATNYSFGDDVNLLDQYGWFLKNSNMHTHPVGEKRPNPIGLYDVQGNVGEWVADDDVGNFSSTEFFSAKSSNYRWWRGGSWSNFSEGLRSTFCQRDYPEGCHSFVGFRLLRRVGKP